MIIHYTLSLKGVLSPSMTKPPIGLLLRSAGNKTSARLVFDFFAAKSLFTYYETMQLLKGVICLLSDEISPIVISVR